jgi:acid phosphatase
MASEFTRREVIAAAPLMFLAPELGRAQPADEGVWRFLVVGDWGRDGLLGQRETAAAMAKVAGAYRTEFVVSTGDNFYNWGVHSATDHRWNTCFEDVYHPDLKPWYAVLGNHDYGGSVQAQIDRGKIPGRWEMDARWYDRPLTKPGRRDLHLFFFDTVTWRGKEQFPHTLRGADVERANIPLQIEQMGAKLRGPGTAIKLAFGHHGVWSVGPHGGKRDLVELDAMLRKADVKAWVHGHDHCLFHLRQGAMHYVCSGAGSKVLAQHRLAGACPAAGCAELGPVEELAYFEKRPGATNHIDGGFALFEAGATSGKFTFFDQQAQARYSSPLY